jgi:hypothetical protein
MREAAGSLSKQRLGKIGYAVVLLIGISTAAFGQIRMIGELDGDWTVLTLAPDGAWGTATEGYFNQAIAKAIWRCRAMSARTLGCGAYSVSIQRGWAIGVRCGDESILATGTILAEAIDRARKRADELRRDYYPEMPGCRTIVTVAPGGFTLARDSGTETSALDRMR